MSLRALAALTLAPLAFCGAFEAHAASLKPEPCRLQSEVAAGGVAAECAWLSVPENREQPDGKQVQLHVARIRSLRLEPAGDPLFVLSGGPGQAASDFYLSIAPALARVRRDRDIVIVDQRGTGKSNRLDCTFPDESDITFTDPQQLRDLTRSCLAKLSGDPRYYTTSVAVRDLDDVRAALGYQRLDLYGVSYGTRVAQHYMRRYPQRVRVAILDAGRADVVLQQIIFDEGDDAEIASVARRVKGDKTGQQFDRRVNRASRYVHRLPVVVQFMLRRV